MSCHNATETAPRCREASSLAGCVDRQRERGARVAQPPRDDSDRNLAQVHQRGARKPGVVESHPLDIVAKMMASSVSFSGGFRQLLCRDGRAIAVRRDTAARARSDRRTRAAAGRVVSVLLRQRRRGTLGMVSRNRPNPRLRARHCHPDHRPGHVTQASRGPANVACRWSTTSCCSRRCGAHLDAARRRRQAVSIRHRIIGVCRHCHHPFLTRTESAVVARRSASVILVSASRCASSTSAPA